MFKTLKIFLTMTVIFTALIAAFLIGNIKKNDSKRIIKNSDSISAAKIEKYISVINDSTQYNQAKYKKELNEKYDLFFSFYYGGDYIGALYIAEEILMNSEPDSKDYLKSTVMMLDCEIQIMMFQKELGNEDYLGVDYYSDLNRLLNDIIIKCKNNKFYVVGDEYLSNIYTNAQTYKEYYSKFSN